MYKAILSVLAISVISGCTAMQKTVESKAIEQNPRIIERDLTKDQRDQNVKSTIKKVAETSVDESEEKVIYKEVIKEVPAQCKPTIAQNNTGLVPVQNKQKKNTFQGDVIEFSNESIVLEQKDKLDAIVSKLKENEQIYLIGHSHGWSKYGTRKLATERTDIVSYHLKQKGVEADRIHKLASWSKKRVSDNPARGVQVFIMNNKDQNRNAHLIMAQL